MVVYYGQAKDEYGLPYRNGADVILRIGTNEITRHTINGSISPGVNFTLYVPIDDGRDDTRYVSYAATTGQCVTIVVVDDRGERTIMEGAAVPCIEHPGDLLRINVTAGMDADMDGLPDEWEWQLLLWGDNPLYHTVEDIVGSDDYDGDGQPNDDEYRAGTFAFLDYDYFFAERLARTANSRLRVEFLSVAGKVYRIESAPFELAGWSFAWLPCEYALTDTGALQTGPAEGTGNWFSFYVPDVPSNHVLRLKVE